MVNKETLLVYTIGHSTHSAEKFIGLVRPFHIQRLLDVRTVPRSRRNPQFNQESFADILQKAGIEYISMKGLGGWRKPAADSVNAGWKNDSFRGYADYMQTETFEKNLDLAITYGQAKQSLILCAEALPWKCHRLLIADALTVRGITVEHILGMSKTIRHELTVGAVVDGFRIVYP